MIDKAPTFATMGASTHANCKREDYDFYATEPKATEILLEVEKFDHNILEPCCGLGHISEVLKAHGYNVISRDLIDRNYGEGNVDFLKSTEVFDGDIITNPPYSEALKFCQKALDTIKVGHKVAMFVKLLFLEGKARKKFFMENPP